MIRRLRSWADRICLRAAICSITGVLLLTQASAQSGYRYTTIDVPSELGTSAYGVNDHRRISGSYYDASLNLHAFLWRDGTLKKLDYPGALETALGDSNDFGVVIGNYGDPNVQHVVLTKSSKRWSIASHDLQFPIPTTTYKACSPERWVIMKLSPLHEGRRILHTAASRIPPIRA